MFCSNCGKELQQDIKYCPDCGMRLEINNENTTSFEEKIQGITVLNKLYEKEKLSLYIWIGIVCYQVLAGFVIPSAWGFALWNSFSCYQTYKFSKQIKQRPIGIYEHYETALVSDIIFLVLNLVLGAGIGAIGAAYDLFTRKYAMENKEILLLIEQEYAKNENS